MKALDVSNYTGALGVSNVQRWRENHGVGLVLVQAITPPAGYPTGVTRQQLDTCAQADMPTDAYLYVWTHSNAQADMANKLMLLEGFTVGRLWLDAEDTAAATVAQRRQAIRDAFAVLDAYSVTHGLPVPGFYTGNWWINSYLGGDASEFAAHPLWLAQYDGVADASQVVLPNGWNACSIKQYAGTSTVEGVPNVDWNVLSDVEAERVSARPPKETDCQELANALAYVADDLGDLIWTKTRSKAIRDAVTEMRRVREQFLGERP